MPSTVRFTTFDDMPFVNIENLNISIYIYDNKNPNILYYREQFAKVVENNDNVLKNMRSWMFELNINNFL